MQFWSCQHKPTSYISTVNVAHLDKIKVRMRPSWDSDQCTTGRTPGGQVATAAFSACSSVKLPGQNLGILQFSTRSVYCPRSPGLEQMQH